MFPFLVNTKTSDLHEIVRIDTAVISKYAAKTSFRYYRTISLVLALQERHSPLAHRSEHMKNIDLEWFALLRATNQEPVILTSTLLLPMRGTYVASIRLDFH